MATLTITVCDECRDPNRPTRNYRITSEGRTVTRDLCEEHGAVLEAMFEQLKDPKTTSRRQYRRGNTRIATMEEIEQVKATRRAK